MKKNKYTAYEAALHLIGYRAQSEWELRTKLKRKGYENSDIEMTVQRLIKEKYVNDEELAKEIFLLYRDNLTYGDRYIQRKLRSRGLTIDDHLTEEEEIEKAEKALLVKRRIIPGFDENYRRAAGFLLRRGFSTHTIVRVLRMFPDE